MKEVVCVLYRRNRRVKGGVYSLQEEQGNVRGGVLSTGGTGE